MAALVDEIKQVAHHLASYEDPRMRNFPYMANPMFVFSAITGYLYIVRNGPKWMKSRPAFELKDTIRMYNVFMVFANLIFLYFEIRAMLSIPNYSLFCQPITGSTTPEFLVGLRALYYYAVVRYIDFFDTFFFILRKKMNQVSALHVIHHVLVAFNASFFLRYAPEGQAAIGLLVNAFVHVIMYSYYFLATYPALRPYLWWKKYLTMVQIIQFLFIISHMAIPLVYDCGFPKYLSMMAICQTFLILALFLNFYIQSYIKTHDLIKNK